MAADQRTRRLTPRQVFEMLKAAGKEFGVDNGGRQAAALTYYSVFALVPALFLMVAIAGFVFDEPSAVNEVVDQVAAVAGDEIGSIIGDLLETVREQRGGALGIGLVLAAFSASGIFQQVQGVLNALFHVPQDKRPSGVTGWLIKRGIALVSALILAVLVLVPVLAVGAIGWLASLLPGALSWLRPVVQFGVPVVSLLMLSVVVGLTFQGLTSITIPWKAAIRGGGATAIAGLAAAFGVGIYLSQAGTTGTLGALGGVAVLLFFFNLMWLVFVFGAEVTKVYSDYLEHGDIVQPDEREVKDRHIQPPVAARPDARPSRPAASVRDKGVLAVLVGVAIGWFGRRR